ncbi:MAG: hypothetical protein ABIC19_03030, partial [Patescibacteria group bacterium]|nr:hypothetical protein [Patescibacteria group bacterium]
FTQNILGANDANNDFDSSTVAANNDGSIVERLEYISQNSAAGTCGNGTVEGGETCDDGNTSWTVGSCAADCSGRNYWSSPEALGTCLNTDTLALKFFCYEMGRFVSAASAVTSSSSLSSVINPTYAGTEAVIVGMSLAQSFYCSVAGGGLHAASGRVSYPSSQSTSILRVSLFSAFTTGTHALYSGLTGYSILVHSYIYSTISSAVSTAGLTTTATYSVSEYTFYTSEIWCTD